MTTETPLKLQRLIDLFEAVDSDPLTKEKLGTDFLQKRWLPLEEMVNANYPAKTPYETKCEELLSETCGVFITQDGANSNYFYIAGVYGLKTKTVESDSFGPLRSSVYSVKHNWGFYYG